MEWKGREMNQKEFKSCFFQWRIPKNLRQEIMKGMQDMGLIEIKKNLVILNDFYFEDNKKKDKNKDGDTKVKSPYYPSSML